MPTPEGESKKDTQRSLTLRLRVPGRTLIVLKPLSLYNGPLGGWTVFVLYSWEQHEQEKETITQRKRRLEKAKLKRQEKIANESDVHKRQRLEKIRLAVAKHRENESLEQRTNRQDTDSTYTREKEKLELKILKS
ncbi:hypothetical protein EVAR_65224_1 [Eumeta japonica]|uniref:Uncharacterized protein n=1 Tax=Eumeta variegata TaxID=151549 RepID=A0A4C1Z9J7_EUMVA|nr:hypothetical protein EVAR_65224_1 [Eumeta japonica]